MRYTWIIALPLLVACPTGKPYDSSDTGYSTCCSFTCSDGTSGSVSFTVDDADCDSYASDQCGLAGADVSSSDFADQEC